MSKRPADPSENEEYEKSQRVHCTGLGALLGSIRDDEEIVEESRKEDIAGTSFTADPDYWQQGTRTYFYAENLSFGLRKLFSCDFEWKPAKKQLDPSK